MTASSAPTSAAAVANAFLDLPKEDSGDFPRIDQMKLYKLVYYAQAWWLATKNEPLFEEGVFAWPWGPVVKELYGSFQSAGHGSITTQRATQFVKDEATGNYYRAEPAKPDEEVMEFLRQVWDVHKNYTGIALSNATHEPGEPWTIVKDTFGGDLSSKPLIPTNMIRDVFKAKIDAATT